METYGESWRRSFMKELFYFSSSELMIRILYNRELHSIDYYSHRNLTAKEHDIVEQYLLNTVASRTKDDENRSALLHYVGVDTDLVRDLNQFHAKDKADSMKETDAIIEKSVKDLIDQSLSNYYFEQIGNTLVKIRRLSGVFDQVKLADEYAKLTKLVEAYNMHVEEPVALDEILPELLSGTDSEA